MENNKISFCGNISQNNSLTVNSLGYLANITQFKSDTIKTAGRSVISPAVIMFNPFTDKDSESRKYNAAMQPIAAIILILSYIVNRSLSKQLLNKLIKNKNFKIIQQNLNNCDKTFVEKYKTVLKDKLGFVINLACVPITSYILNTTYPKILNIWFKKKPDTASFVYSKRIDIKG